MKIQPHVLRSDTTSLLSSNSSPLVRTETAAMPLKMAATMKKMPAKWIQPTPWPL